MVANVLQMAWEMEGEQETLKRQWKSRRELLEEAILGECVENCNGQWLKFACKVLQQNGIEESYFAEQVYELLTRVVESTETL